VLVRHAEDEPTLDSSASDHAGHDEHRAADSIVLRGGDRDHEYALLVAHDASDGSATPLLVYLIRSVAAIRLALGQTGNEPSPCSPMTYACHVCALGATRRPK
jgi:hypothetical protein